MEKVFWISFLIKIKPRAIIILARNGNIKQ